MKRIIEIKTLPNGAHRNQSGSFRTIPEGYAVIPKGMKTPNFPFGEVRVEKIDGVMTVAEWTPGVVPEEEQSERPVNPIEQLRADVDYIAAMTGVEL